MNFTEQHVAHACNYLQSKYPNKDCDFYKFGLAVEILRVLVDNEWVNQAIFSNDHLPKSKAMQGAIEFLRSREIGYEFQENVYRLVARLYDLQDVPNISRVIAAIKEGNLGAYAEIEAGRHLGSRDIEFSYVLPQGTKATDFDIEIQGNPKINCEIKHKLETTALSKETLESTFSDAKSQVPQDMPSLFFVKIPEEWIKSNELERALNSFFSRSPNVIGIMFRWEEREPLKEGIFYWKYLFEANPHYFSGTSETIELVRRLGSKPTRPIQLDEMLGKYIEPCRSSRAG